MQLFWLQVGFKHRTQALMLPHLCPLPPGELLDQIMHHTHKGFARTAFNSQLDKYVSSLF